MVGRTVGRYRITAALGEGGMGSVWKAEDPLLGRSVALKLLSPELASSEDARRRFLREARAASSLNHPGICAVHDAGEADGQIFIALSLVDGHTVSALAERAPLAIADVVRLGIAVAEALGHAHAHGVVHRDVTGRNIMVARDGHAVVLDFGLATAVGFSRMTSSGSRIGTVGYMAPEVVAGECADARSDLYGLGVVLYEALTGTLPFESGRVEAVLYSIMNETPEPPSRRRRDVPAALEGIVMRLLSREPAARYAEAEAVVRDLRALATEAEQPAAPAWREAPAGPGSPSRRRYIAVLPFEVAAPAEATEVERPFARGLAEVLATSLAREPGLHVIRPAVAGVEEITDDLQQTARQLGANLIVRGAVRRAGLEVRVTWSLLDPARGVQIGGDTIAGVAADPFRLEDRLDASVRAALGIEAVAGARATRPRDPAARERFVEALGYLQRYENEASVDGAIALLERLRDGEGESAAILGALGRAYLFKHQLTVDPKWETLAAHACERAVALDPDSPDVLITLGELFVRTGQSERAVESFERALAIDPERAEALMGLGRACLASGRPGDAERAMRRAVELRPGYWGGHNQLGRLLLRLGRYEEARGEFERVLQLSPDNARGWLNLSTALFLSGRHEAALEAGRRAVDIRPRGPAFAQLGAVLFYLGRYEEARAAFERGVALSPADPQMWGNFGSACSFLPDRLSQGREALEHAMALARERLSRNSRDSNLWCESAGWLSNLSRHEDAAEAVSRALRLEPGNPAFHAKACAVHEQAGHRDAALASLADALRLGFHPGKLEHDPHLAGLCSDPRFRKMVEGMNAQRQGGRPSAV